MFVVYTTPITESVKRLEPLSIRYKEYQDVFEKISAPEMIQEFHCPYLKKPSSNTSRLTLPSYLSLSMVQVQM
jgi:hypothetical protein